MARKYEHLWSALLAKKTLSVKARKELGMTTSRLIKAVFKEKDLDLVSRRKYALRAEIDKNDETIVHFRLLRRINILNI